MSLCRHRPQDEADTPASPGESVGNAPYPVDRDLFASFGSVWTMHGGNLLLSHAKLLG